MVRSVAIRRLVDILALISFAVHSAQAFSAKLFTDDIVHLHPDGSANDVLCRILNNKVESSVKQPISLQGFVSKRRAVGKSLVFLDIIPCALPQLETHEQRKKEFIAEDFASVKPVQALFRREFWSPMNEENSSFDVYKKIIQPGVHCRLMGEAGPSRIPNEALLFCHSASYTLPNDNPQHLRNVLRFARDGLLDFNEISIALPSIDNAELSQMLGLTEQYTNRSMGECATEILSRFPRNFLFNPSKLMGSTNSAKVALLPPLPEEYKLPSGFVTPDDLSDKISTIDHVIASLEQSEDVESKPLRQFTFSGWVQNRRRFQDSITVVELVGNFSSSAEIMERNADLDMTKQNSPFSNTWKDRIHVVIQPNALGVHAAELYGNILAAGSQVLVHGPVAHADSAGITICWASTCRLLHSSWKLNVVRHILELLHENKIPIDEAADSLSFEGGYAQADNIAQGTTSSTERQWLAAEVSKSLQGEHSRTAKVTPEMLQSLDLYSSFREEYPIEPINADSSLDELSERSRATLILQSNSTSRRTATTTSRWQRAKQPQLIWMIDQISNVLTSHPEYRQRKLKVVDIGGGKGLLSNLLAEAFGDQVEVQVVDVSKAAINNGMMRARRRGIDNVRYNAQDASTLNVEGVDVVVALHACGTLSDIALGHAVSHGAGFVICPCCFLSNSHLRVPTAKGNPLITAEEWLQVEPKHYEPLKQVAELQGDMNLASTGMHSICAMRAASVSRLWKNARWPDSTISTTIKSFPIGFSTRNLCLVGTFESSKGK